MAAADTKQKTGTCVYCRAEGPITADHVPLAFLLSDSKPKEPHYGTACQSCNKLFALDDDYVRFIFTTAEGAIGNPSRDALRGLMVA